MASIDDLKQSVADLETLVNTLVQALNDEKQKTTDLASAAVAVQDADPLAPKDTVSDKNIDDALTSIKDMIGRVNQRIGAQ